MFRIFTFLLFLLTIVVIGASNREIFFGAHGERAEDTVAVNAPGQKASDGETALEPEPEDNSSDEAQVAPAAHESTSEPRPSQAEEVSDPPSPLAPVPNTAPVSDPLPLSNENIHLWTNIHRNAEGVFPSLGGNAQLDAIALSRLRDMFEKEYFDHVAPDGTEVSGVAKAEGYEYLAIGENLAFGHFKSAEEMVVAWMESPGHRKNILSTSFTELGVAVEQGTYKGDTVWIGVQVFGRPRSTCPIVDAVLKAQIDENNVRIEFMKQSVAALYQEVQALEGEGGGAYNEKVEEYNTLVGEVNKIIQATKELVAEYNDQVLNHNLCIVG